MHAGGPANRTKTHQVRSFYKQNRPVHFTSFFLGQLRPLRLIAVVAAGPNKSQRNLQLPPNFLWQEGEYKGKPK